MIFCIVTGTLTSILVMTQKILNTSAILSMFEGKKYLTQLQLKSNLLKHHLKQEVPIHWNSTYYTLEQLLEHEKRCARFCWLGCENQKKRGAFF